MELWYVCPSAGWNKVTQEPNFYWKVIKLLNESDNSWKQKMYSLLSIPLLYFIVDIITFLSLLFHRVGENKSFIIKRI